MAAIDRNGWSRCVGTSGHDPRNGQGNSGIDAPLAALPARSAEWQGAWGAAIRSAVVVALHWCPTTAHAKSDNLDALNKQVHQLYQVGKYAEAIPLVERYVTLAYERYGLERTELATAICWLAFLYQAQGWRGRAALPARAGDQRWAPR